MTLARSSVPGVVWPAIPSAAASLMLAMQHQLQDSQWWPPARVREHQARQLGELLRHAHRTIPFWRQRIEACGLAGASDFSFERFARLPILTRREVQDQGPRLRAPSYPREHGGVVHESTSGSTAEPLRFWATDLCLFFEQAFALRDHLWHERDLSQTLLAIRVLPAGVHAGWFMGPNGQPILDTGPSVVVPIRMPLAEQAEAILDHRPAYLQGHATHLRELAVHWLERGLPHPGIRQVRSFAEVLAPQTRELIRQAWGAGVADVYSTQECGCLALQCPRHEHLHVQAESACVEVIREDGAPCGPGEIGRVIVTPLHNFAMPLLRYDVGDYAEAGEACECGRGLPVLKRVAGRVRNMMVLPDGDRQWPLIGYKYRELAPVRQFQAVQTALDEIELRLVVERTLDANEEARVREHLLDRLGRPFRVRLSYVDAIPRSQGGKYEDFVCAIAPGR